MAIAIAGCGGDDESQTSTAATASTTTNSATTTGTQQRPSSDGGRPGSQAGAGTGNAGSAAPGSQQPPDQSTTNTPPAQVGTVEPGAGPDADERAVIRTFRVFLIAISQADGAKACAQMTDAGRAALERRLANFAPETQGAPCESSIVIYQGAFGDKNDDPKLGDPHVEGDRARISGPVTQSAVLVKQGNVWLIDRYSD